MNKFSLFTLSLATFCASCSAPSETYINMSKYGIIPDSNFDYTIRINHIIDSVTAANTNNDSIIFVFEKGRYDLYPHQELAKTYYISNHDQINPKLVGINLYGKRRIAIDGNGAEFICHGRMLPIAIANSGSCSFSDFSIDFNNPQIAQVQIIANDTVNGIIQYQPAPWVNYDISADSIFSVYGDGWRIEPCAGIAFEPDTRHIVYRTSDISVGTHGVTQDSTGIISAPWNNPRLKTGTIVAMRNYERPAPGIFITECENIAFDNVNVHYAEGMGLLAQMTENIFLNRFNVCLRGENDPRYFTTQADATHFSGCKGVIKSTNSIYENMMDDAINVHGTYLKIQEIIDDTTLVAEYMHHQAYGFLWATPGDSIQFIASNVMEIVGSPNLLKTISPIDAENISGAKRFQLTFSHKIPEEVNLQNGAYGIENLSWTPQVYFAGNCIRNNRARGALFSTPQRVIAENNTFDHTSGTAILLCGDCNGWFETGACRDVVIRKNKFINALTNLFQFTNAVISIYPEIPNLKDQKLPFHHGVVIENNEFITFDKPLLYAKSVDSLVFKNNTVEYNNDYPPFHWNDKAILLENVINSDIEEPRVVQSYK